MSTTAYPVLIVAIAEIAPIVPISRKLKQMIAGTEGACLVTT
jgi:hypothetical protein